MRHLLILVLLVLPDLFLAQNATLKDTSKKTNPKPVKKTEKITTVAKGSRETAKIIPEITSNFRYVQKLYDYGKKPIIVVNLGYDIIGSGTRVNSSSRVFELQRSKVSDSLVFTMKTLAFEKIILIKGGNVLRTFLPQKVEMTHQPEGTNTFVINFSGLTDAEYSIQVIFPDDKINKDIRFKLITNPKIKSVIEYK